MDCSDSDLDIYNWHKQHDDAEGIDGGFEDIDAVGCIGLQRPCSSMYG